MGRKYIVVHIDKGSFKQLTHGEYPFILKKKTKDYMVKTLEHLMNSRIRILYGYTHNNEFSLLFVKDKNISLEEYEKLSTLFSNDASEKFLELLNNKDEGDFDCQIIQLPNLDLVEKYFIWEQDKAKINVLNNYCYLKLKEEGLSGRKALTILEKLNMTEKNEFILKKGIDFESIPLWEKRGVGIYWEKYMEEVFNPKKNRSFGTLCKRLKIVYELPVENDYTVFIQSLFKQNNQS